MANIKVNDGQWNALSTDEQNAIIEGLITTKALEVGDKIVPDPNVQPFTEATIMEPMWNPLNDLCKAGCDIAAAAAAAWCTANTAGIATAACLAAAEAARQACRDRC